MTGSEAVRSPKRARLYVTRIDPWSVTKAAFMLALAIGIVLVVAVAVLWWVLDFTGVFLTLSRTIDEVVGSATTGFDLLSYLEFSRVIGVATVVASVEIVLGLGSRHLVRGHVQPHRGSYRRCRSRALRRGVTAPPGQH